MRADTAALVLGGLFLTTVSCNERTVTSTNPGTVAPSPTLPAPAPVPAPQPGPAPIPVPPPLPLTVLMTLARTSLFVGESTTGTILMSRPAPAPGVMVTLASNDPGVVVSPQVATLAPDQDRMTFTVTTSPSLAQDRRVAITASMSDASTSGTLQVWTMPRAQTFFAFISEPGDYIGQGTVVRLVSPETAFNSLNTGATAVVISDTPRFVWIVRFYAPLNSQLTARRYDNVTSIVDPTHAALLITGPGRGCSSTGWFEVREISLTARGDLARFDATFEQRCSDSGPSTLRGEVKFVR